MRASLPTREQFATLFDPNASTDSRCAVLSLDARINLGTVASYLEKAPLTSLGHDTRQMRRLLFQRLVSYEPVDRASAEKAIKTMMLVTHPDKQAGHPPALQRVLRTKAVHRCLTQLRDICRDDASFDLVKPEGSNFP